jgi:creatinine amidohydrolase
MSTRVEGQPPGLALRRSFRAISETGVIGDARTATAAKGEALLAAIGMALAGLLLNEKLWA